MRKVVRLLMGTVVAAAGIGAPALLAGIGVTAASSSPAGASTTCPYEVVLGHADGGVSVLAPSGDTCPSEFHGSMAGRPLNEPIVGMASTPDGGGYWLVASDGGIFAFGDAQFHGSMGGLPLNEPIVGMASTPDGGGYWLVASDGGIFAFGDAQFHGSMGGLPLNKPVVGMAADGSTGGYWLTASDGGIFAFDAPFFGSMGGRVLNAPIAFVTGTPDAGGYRMVGSDGGVFNFGDAQFYGSAAAPGSAGWQALTGTPDGGGYWLFSSSSTDAFGNAAPQLAEVSGDASTATIVGAATLGLGDGPPSTGGFFNDVSCPTSSMCMAVGQTSGSSALVEVSTNGGSSFTSIPVPSAPALVGVSCADAAHCVAVGGSTVLSTTDGGQSWATTTAGQDLQRVSCATDTSCAAVGYNGGGARGVSWFVHTANGSTWQSSSSVPPLAIAIDVSCTGSTCVAVGTGIYVSTDGGGTWASGTVDSGFNAPPTAVSCVTGSQTCLVVGPYPELPPTTVGGVLLITTDGGSTWTNASTNLPAATAGMVRIACGAGGDCVVTGVSVSGSGGIISLGTTTAGSTWSSLTAVSGLSVGGSYVSTIDQGLGIACSSATACVMVGKGSTGAGAAVTSDGGASWTVATTQ